jgi:hypothetical protein
MGIARGEGNTALKENIVAINDSNASNSATITNRSDDFLSPISIDAKANRTETLSPVPKIPNENATPQNKARNLTNTKLVDKYRWTAP